MLQSGSNRRERERERERITNAYEKMNIKPSELSVEPIDQNSVKTNRKTRDIPFQ
jgi:hypothetical protein